MRPGGIRRKPCRPASAGFDGAAGGFDQGLTLGEVVLGASFNIIAPSRFGSLGAPTSPQPTVQAQADVYACLLDALGIDHERCA